MNLLLTDNGLHLEFAPLTLLKPVAKLLVGAFIIEDRWKELFPDAQISYETEDYLSKKFPANPDVEVRIAANVIPNLTFASFLKDNWGKSVSFQGKEIVRFSSATNSIEFVGDLVVLEKRWDLFKKNAQILVNDLAIFQKRGDSEKLPDYVTVIGDENKVFLSKGAKVLPSILNTTDGPIILDEDSEIMEGSMVRGGLYLGQHAALKMGTKLYGATSIGHYSKVGGEVGNSVVQPYSNKGHDGYIGNALIGEWCNLGADTNSSNLKNNYGRIRTYNYALGGEEQTQEQFMGLTMGDHSKCGINTMFNTATVIGISSNIYGGDFPQKFIPSFQWGGAEFVPFKFDKAVEAANAMMVRRGKKLEADDLKMLRFLYDKK